MKPAAESVLDRFLVGRTGSQRRPEALVGGVETIVNFIDVAEFGSVDFAQRRLDRLNLQHAIGNHFTFELI
jgi:hypothetical protein